jgi:hypothetical protein
MRSQLETLRRRRWSCGTRSSATVSPNRPASPAYSKRLKATNLGAGTPRLHGILEIVDQTKQTLAWCYIGDEENVEKIADILSSKYSVYSGVRGIVADVAIASAGSASRSAC